ncbi:hypothetical protein AVEN_148713-1, partial [Araneus ventricosus]
TRILERDRRATLPHIAADFNDGASTSVSVRTVQRTVINMGSQSRRPTRVPLLTERRPKPPCLMPVRHPYRLIGLRTTVTDSTAQSFIPLLGPTTLPLDCR